MLARQHLLAPSTGTISATLAAIGGLQAQYVRDLRNATSLQHSRG